jgi:hypothetical protein
MKAQKKTRRYRHSPVAPVVARDNDWQLGRVMVNRDTPVFKTRGRQGKIAVYSHRVFWRPEERELLRQTYGRAPLSEVARSLGRSQMAVRDMAKRMGIPVAQSRQDLWTVDQLAAAFGIWDNSARLLWLRGDLPTVTLYMADTPVRMVYKAQVLQFAANPLNWYALPHHGRWTDPELKRVRDIALVTWGDKWVRATEAGRVLNIAPHYVKRLIKKGELPNSRISAGCWFVLQSEVQALAKKRGWVYQG